MEQYWDDKILLRSRGGKSWTTW